MLLLQSKCTVIDKAGNEEEEAHMVNDKLFRPIAKRPIIFGATVPATGGVLSTNKNNEMVALPEMPATGGVLSTNKNNEMVALPEMPAKRQKQS